MRDLTDEGRALAEEVARRHDVSADAVSTLFLALDRGGGTQAQFSHPDLGGMGQWSRNGITMVGDMFDNQLKARVDALCSELSDLMRDRDVFVPRATGALGAGSAWWPKDFGTPSSSGSQNDMGYACFPEAGRLAIRREGKVRIYDTGDHRIGGVSQQQSGDQDLSFTSQHGVVRLHDLALVGDTPAEPSTAQRHAEPPMSGNPASNGASRPSADDVFGIIERLHQLQQKGILSAEEFAEKKKELLARL